MKTLPLWLLALSLPLPEAAAQAPGAHWSITTVVGSMPPLRRENPGASDGTGMLVFGGIDMTTGLRRNDLWRFDGTSWSQLSADGAAGSPPARAQCAVAWDSARARLVVFGGHDGTARLGDTWEWDGTQWLNVTPAGTSPSPRNFCAMAFDLRSGRVLLFGGNDGSYQNDTWQWDGIGWTQLNPATQPAARQQHGMVTRIDQPDVLMCCGQNATTRFGDTWLWNGTDWRQVVTATLPAPRVALDIAYDAVRGQVVIPGGNNSSLNPVGNIAEFDGTDWVNRAQDPVILKRTRYFLAFVPSLGRTYMFGGQQVSAPAPAGTYDYQTDFVARYATFGSGCATAAGTPTLAPTHAPWLGETLTVAVTGLEASSLVFMAVGFSDTAWIGGALPTPVSTLYPQTGPGCNLQVSPEITVLLINNGGTADYQLSLPNNSALVGGVMFNQAAQLELNGNLSVSGGGRMTIGIK